MPKVSGYSVLPIPEAGPSDDADLSLWEISSRAFWVLCLIFGGVVFGLSLGTLMALPSTQIIWPHLEVMGLGAFCAFTLGGWKCFRGLLGR